MRKIVKNTTLSSLPISDTGISIPTSPDSYEIPSQDFWLWAASSDVVDAIVSGDVIVNDGEDDLPKRAAIALIQDNQMVLNEHYTLVQGDDILVGNGQILYLNDEFDTTSNVPHDLDEDIEEDVPTED